MKSSWQKPKLKEAPVPASPAAAAAPAWRGHAIIVLALWGIALLAYSNSFRNGLPFDSDIVLRDSRITAVNSQNLDLIFHQEYWYNRMTTGLYRPLTTLTFLFNYAILGEGMNAAGYHWVNFALHALNIALAYLLALTLLGDRMLAAAAAALWSVHPVLTESVTNMVGRSDLLAGFGVLAGLLCHIYAGRSSTRRAGWLAALSVAAAIGLFSKESAIVLLAAMALYDMAFPGWRSRAAGYAAAGISVALFFAVRQSVLSKLPSGEIPFADNPLTAADFWTSRFTAVKVIGKYLALLVWPAHLSCDYSYNQIPLSTWSDWPTWAAVAACLALAAAGVFCYRRRPLLTFLIGLFFAALAPTANIAILIGTIMAERFLYLPALAFAIAVVLLVRRLPGRSAAVTVVLICVAYSSATFARNFDWHDEVSLWRSAAAAAPASFKVHNSLAAVLLANPAELDRAVAEADRSLAILDPLPDGRNTPAAYANAAAAYRTKGDSAGPDARRWYEKALAALLRGQRIDRYYGEVLRRQNQAQGRKVAITGWAPLYLELGRIYNRLGDGAKAVEALEFGRRLRPDAAYFEELSSAWRKLGDPQKAAISLMEGLGIDPNNVRFAAELVDLYRETQPQSCAIQGTGGAVSLNLGCPLVHDHLCTATRNVAVLLRQRGQGADANAAVRSAIADLGCPASLFQ
jgi:tetratricopeptide (TPR) repeat protein